MRGVFDGATMATVMMMMIMVDLREHVDTADQGRPAPLGFVTSVHFVYVVSAASIHVVS